MKTETKNMETKVFKSGKKIYLFQATNGWLMYYFKNDDELYSEVNELIFLKVYTFCLKMF